MYDVDGAISISVMATLFIAGFTVVLARGLSESKWTNLVLTSLKVFIVMFVILGGASKARASNWSPFVPEGTSSVFAATSVVFFAYIGFDVVANSAEEAARPRQDLPFAIVTSLAVCCALYVGVCLVITGLQHYSSIDKSAPLSTALTQAGLAWGQQIVNIGAVVGLGTTLLTGLYAQSRLYLSIARDGLLPRWMRRVGGLGLELDEEVARDRNGSSKGFRRPILVFRKQAQRKVDK